MASIVSDPFDIKCFRYFTELLTSSEIDDENICSRLRGSLKKKSEEVLNSSKVFHLDENQSFTSVLALGHKQFLDDMKTALSSELDYEELMNPNQPKLRKQDFQFALELLISVKDYEIIPISTAS